MDVFAIIQSASATLLAAAIVGLVRFLRRCLAGISGKLDAIGEATQATMRATLVHNYEKYQSRGWLTPEERASWCDMYEKYEGLGANGYIRSYRANLDGLPDRSI
jgi:hypothetical protein